MRPGVWSSGSQWPKARKMPQGVYADLSWIQYSKALVNHMINVNKLTISVQHTIHLLKYAVRTSQIELFSTNNCYIYISFLQFVYLNNIDNTIVSICPLKFIGSVEVCQNIVLWHFLHIYNITVLFTMACAGLYIINRMKTWLQMIINAFKPPAGTVLFDLSRRCMKIYISVTCKYK